MSGAWVTEYLRTPFLEKGRTLEGADCWGLVKEIYRRELGIELPSYLDCYDNTNDRDALGKLIDQEKASKWREPETPKEFDIIVLNMRGVPMHVGVVTKPFHMIHCARGVGTALERYDGLKWRLKVMGFAQYDR